MLCDSTIVVTVKMGQKVCLGKSWVGVMECIDEYCCIGYPFVSGAGCLFCVIVLEKKRIGLRNK